MGVYSNTSLGLLYMARYTVPLNFALLVVFTVVQAIVFSVATVFIQNSIFFEILLVLALGSVFLAGFSQLTHKFRNSATGGVRRNAFGEEDLPINIFVAVSS